MTPAYDRKCGSVEPTDGKLYALKYCGRPNLHCQAPRCQGHPRSNTTEQETKAVKGGRAGSAQYEEQPEHLVDTLNQDVLPHLLADQRFSATRRLHEQ